MEQVLERYWINQPSTLEPNHDLHGALVLAPLRLKEINTVYFTSGKIISGRYPKNILSKGWPEHLLKHKTDNTIMTKKNTPIWTV